jgi:hypothetical protein
MEFYIGRKPRSNGRGSYLGGAAVPVLVAICACGSAPADHGWGSGEGGVAANGSSGGGSSASNPNGSATPGGLNGEGGLLRGNSDGAAGSGDAMAAQSCTPFGSTRPCCGGTQTCAGSAEFPVWSPCLDATGTLAMCLPPPPAPPTCAGTEFNPSCDAGLDSGGAPDGGCGATMVCKPGKIRYCDWPGTEWTMSTCDATGNWGPCVPAIAPQGAGCVQSSFMPEICCPPLHLCCQDNPGGPWKDWGGGGCAAISCP